MDLETTIKDISDFLIRQKINNKHVKTIQSAHLDSVYYKILNTVKTRKILSLASDISFLIGVKKVEIKITDIANTICIAIPRAEKKILEFSKIIKSKQYKENKGDLKFILGENTDGDIIVKDLKDMTHLLIAGQTGSGKSVFLNSLISSLMQTKNVNFIMVDTKKVELSPYQDLNSLLFPLCTDGEQTISALSWVVNEMTKRYDIFKDKGVRNLDEYNNIPKIKKMKRIVVIIDELADLMMTSGKIVETLICRIAQLSRASGIHLVIATQRPSCDVLTGLIKANLPTRIAFSVSSKINSRVILDRCGAEQLLGQGDMVFLSADNQDLLRLQGVYISNNEIIDYVKKANEKNKVVVKKQDILIESIIDYLTNKKDKNITDAELEEVFKITEIQASDIMNKLERQNIVGEYNLFSPRAIFI